MNHHDDASSVQQGCAQMVGGQHVAIPIICLLPLTPASAAAASPDCCQAGMTNANAFCWQTGKSLNHEPTNLLHKQHIQYLWLTPSR
jgi:hypothetical protein